MRMLLLLVFLFLFNITIVYATQSLLNVFIAGTVFGLLIADIVALLRKKK